MAEWARLCGHAVALLHTRPMAPVDLPGLGLLRILKSVPQFELHSESYAIHVAGLILGPSMLSQNDFRNRHQAPSMRAQAHLLARPWGAGYPPRARVLTEKKQISP